MPKVTVIPSSVDLHTHLPQSAFRKKRVAAYARVSTDSDEQLTSYEAQTDYYEKLIRSKPEWEFAGMYADEGISGTSTRNRPGFNAMIEDALAGKIDLIVTKSVSRFARNTVDSLTMIRTLKEKGIGCYFEKENIYTLDSKGELLITIMSSLAQEESRSISQNVTWGVRKAMADGKVRMSFASFLGYKRGEGGKIEVDKEQADTVRSIYRWFLKGCSINEIAKRLMSKGIRSPMGMNKWRAGTVRSILTNEKYKGDALLQKTYTEDFLTHRHVKNNGEVQQYYVEGGHEAIIEPEEWEMVQQEMRRRNSLKGKFSGSGPFSCRIVCADCGSFFGPKVWHSTDKYRRTVWRCNAKFDNERKCGTPAVTEESIKDGFVKAYNAYVSKVGLVLADSDLFLSALEDPASYDDAIAQAENETREWEDVARKLVERNSAVALDQAGVSAEYERVSAEFERVSGKLEDLKSRKATAVARRKVMEAYLAGMRKAPRLLEAWDEDVWLLSIEQVVIHDDGKAEYVFKDGSKVEVKIA